MRLYVSPRDPKRHASRMGVLALIAAVFALAVPATHAAEAAPTPPSIVANAPAALSSDSSLVGYWPFELGSAGADLSGSGNTLIAADGLGLTSDAAPTPFANQTALLSSLSPNSYATAPGTNIDDLQQFTMSFWLRMRSFPLSSHPMNLVGITNKANIT